MVIPRNFRQSTSIVTITADTISAAPPAQTSQRESVSNLACIAAIIASALPAKTKKFTNFYDGGAAHFE
jgi:hypothetical protein